MTDFEVVRMYGTNACSQKCYLNDPTAQHVPECGKAALARIEARIDELEQANDPQHPMGGSWQE